MVTLLQPWNPSADTQQKQIGGCSDCCHWAERGKTGGRRQNALKPTGSILLLVKISQLQIQSGRPLHRQPPRSHFFFLPARVTLASLATPTFSFCVAKSRKLTTAPARRPAQRAGSPYSAVSTWRLAGIRRFEISFDVQIVPGRTTSLFKADVSHRNNSHY